MVPVGHRSRALLLIAALGLSACGKTDALLVLEGPDSEAGQRAQQQGGKTLAGQERPLSDVDDPKVFLETAAAYATRERKYESAAAHYAKLTAMDPGERRYVGELARNLRILGRHPDAERVLRQGLRDHPNDPDLTEELAKVMIASGRLREGVSLMQSLAGNPKLPRERLARLHSAMGVAFDRAGKPERAREQYAIALKADPLSVSALNNLGLSYAMNGDLERSERALRRALVQPRASEQVRQNLAMVLALRGKTNEASRLAQQDLPDEMAKELVSYYSGIVDQRAVWQDASGN